MIAGQKNNTIYKVEIVEKVVVEKVERRLYENIKIT